MLETSAFTMVRVMMKGAQATLHSQQGILFVNAYKVPFLLPLPVEGLNIDDAEAEQRHRPSCLSGYKG